MNLKLFFCFVFVAHATSAASAFADKTIYIALPQQNTHVLQELLDDVSDINSPNYGHYLTAKEIANIVSAPKEDRAKVIDFLLFEGMEVIDFGDSLKVTGTQEKINQLFQNNGQTYTVPEQIQDHVVFIEGLIKKVYPRNSKMTQDPNASNAASESSKYSNPASGYAAREVVERVYSIDLNSSNITSIAAIEYQGNSGFRWQDMELSQKMSGVPIYNVSYVVGKNHLQDTESALDMQEIAQIASGSDIWYWENKEWLYAFAVNFFNAEKIPDVVSMSWGWAEREQCAIAQCNGTDSQVYIQRVNVEYLKIGLRGTTIVVASGDAGAPGRTNELCDTDVPAVNPVFPGSSPYVLSVGATYLLPGITEPKWETPMCQKFQCINGTEERVTNFAETGWTSGGGFSIYDSELTPSWQAKAVQSYFDQNPPLPQNTTFQGRAYPDVAAVGHNCPTHFLDMWWYVDGTSCSAPIFASIISLLNNHQLNNGKPKLGFINPLIYQMYYTDPLIFNDISEGNNWCTEGKCCPNDNNGSNFGYSATYGYDPVTGLGTVNVSRMVEWLDLYT